MTVPKFRAWTEEGKVMYYDIYPFKDDTLLLSYDESRNHRQHLRKSRIVGIRVIYIYDSVF